MDLRNFADDRQIAISGFKNSDVDISLIKNAITTLSILKSEFPKIADNRHKLILLLFELKSEMISR